MMKLSGLLILIIAAVHLFIWPLNKEVYESHRKQQKAHAREDVKNFSQYRTEYESQQKESLNRYHRSDKRSEYVQIPIERAFDYYLRTHPKL